MINSLGSEGGMRWDEHISPNRVSEWILSMCVGRGRGSGWGWVGSWFREEREMEKRMWMTLKEKRRKFYLIL